MIIGIPKETLNGENRIGVTPHTVKDLIKNDFQVLIESNAGLGSFIDDASYQSAGAKIVNASKELYDSSAHACQSQCVFWVPRTHSR